MNKLILIILLVVSLGFISATTTDNNLTILNTPPTVESSSLSPIPAYTNSTLICTNGVKNDDNGEEVTLSYDWFKDLSVISGETTSSLGQSNFVKNDQIICQITPNDGNGDGDPKNSSSLTISNLVPSITNIPNLEEDADGSTWEYDTNASDLDVDDGVDTLSWYVNNTILDINISNGVLSDTPIESDFGSYSIRVNVTDSDSWDEQNITYTVNDVTPPRIQYVSGMIANDSSVPQNFIFINITYTEPNFKNITYNLYDMDGLVESYSTTSIETSHNFTSLGDEYYKFNVTMYDQDNNKNTTNTRWATLDTTPPEINLTQPESTSEKTYEDGTNLPLNFTISDDTPTTCWFDVIDELGGIEINNRSIPGCTNTTFNLTISDFYTLNIYVNDSAGNENSDSVDFLLSQDKPSTTLNSPTDNSWVNTESTYFNFTTLDFDGIGNCKLYSNFTGTWGLNETFNFVTSGLQVSTLKSLSDDGYIWNVLCEDRLGSSQFSSSNYTVNVDLTNPNSTILTENDTQIGGSTFTLKYNITDERSLNSCYFTIFDSAGDPHNYGSNASLDCDLNTRDLTTLDFGTFTIRVWGEDSAGNLDSDEITFTTVNVETGSGGGGSTPVIIGSNETLWTMETSSGTGIYQINRLPGDKVVLPIIFENKGIIEQNILLECKDVQETICDRISFEDNNFVLEPLQDTKYIVNFIIDIPDNAENQFKFNIEGIDNFGRKGIITVELNTDLGFINTIFTKLFLSSAKLLYFLLFIVLSISLGYIFDKGVGVRLFDNRATATFVSIFFGFFASLIIIGLPFI